MLPPTDCVMGKAKSLTEGQGREQGGGILALSEWAVVPMGTLHCCVLGERIFHCNLQGEKKSFLSLFWPMLAETTHKPLITTAKRELADMKLAQIIDITIL